MVASIKGKSKFAARARRHRRVRAVVHGTAERPRLVVTRSNRHMVAQVIGAIIGAAVLYLCTSTSGDAVVGTGANACQPGVSVVGGLVAEIVFTFVFVLVVLGTTDAKKGAGNFAGLAIGLSLVLVHLVCIRYTGTSVNPARSIGPALFQGGEALSQLWIFIVGPFAGGALAALVWKCLGCDCKK